MFKRLHLAQETQTVTMDIPFAIKMFEYFREDSPDDEDIHFVTENMIEKADKPLTMDVYKEITSPGDE